MVQVFVRIRKSEVLVLQIKCPIFASMHCGSVHAHVYECVLTVAKCVFFCVCVFVCVGSATNGLTQWGSVTHIHFITKLSVVKLSLMCSVCMHYLHALSRTVAHTTSRMTSTGTDSCMEMKQTHSNMHNSFISAISQQPNQK